MERADIQYLGTQDKDREKANDYQYGRIGTENTEEGTQEETKGEVEKKENKDENGNTNNEADNDEHETEETEEERIQKAELSKVCDARKRAEAELQRRKKRKFERETPLHLAVLQRSGNHLVQVCMQQ